MLRGIVGGVPMVRLDMIHRASPYEIMQAWQAGLIGYRDAIRFTAAENLFDLYQACRSSDVELRKELTEREKAAVDSVVSDLLQ